MVKLFFQCLISSCLTENLLAQNEEFCFSFQSTILCISSEVNICHYRCMGEKGNVVHELAKDKYLLETSVAIQGYYNLVQSDGQRIPEELSTKIIEMGLDIYRGDKYAEEKKNYNGSLGNFIAEK